MNVGEAITAGMRADRARDIKRACAGHWGDDHVHPMGAWALWGWSLTGRGGLGCPGWDFGA